MLCYMPFFKLSIVVSLGFINNYFNLGRAFAFENLMKVTQEKGAHLHKIVLHFRQT